MFWFDNEFCVKNEYIRLFLGTLVGKRKQAIFKKRWFDITMDSAVAVRRSDYCVPQNRGLRRCWAPAHSTCRTGPSYKQFSSYLLICHRVRQIPSLETAKLAVGTLLTDSRLDLIHDLLPEIYWCLHCAVHVHVRWTGEKVRGAKVHKDGSKIPTWQTVPLVYKL